MNGLTAVYLSFVVIVGSFLQVKMGLGLGVLCMVFFPMMFEFHTAVGLCVVIACVSAFYIMVRFFRDIRWKVLLPVAFVSVTISTISTLLSLQADQSLLKVILGCFLVLLAIYFCWFSEKIKLRPTLGIGLAMGAAAGIGNGLFGLGGPPVALYLMASTEDNQAYVATIQTYFLFSNVVAMLVRTFTGAVGTVHIPYILLGWASAALGTFLGIKIFPKISGPMLKRLVYAFIALSGVITVLQALKIF